jgi:hypothetical protein
MFRKTIVLIILSVFVVALGYPAATAQTQRAATGGLPKKFRNAFVGRIADKYAIHMDLTRSGETLSGSYYYDNIGDDIDLSGTIEPGGQFKLTETDREGKTTATFSGKIVVSTVDGQPALAISGTWKKAGAAAPLSLSLTEVRYDIGLGAKLESKKINQDIKKPKYSIDVEYPQVVGIVSPGQAAFNKFINSLITKRVTAFKKEVADDADIPPDSMGSSFDVNYNIEMASGNLITISFLMGTYSAGAAHPNYFYETVNFDTEKGTEIKLSNLFKPNSKYLSAISRYCITQLRKKLGEDAADTINVGAAASADNFGSWCITDIGLMIFFSPYQVASYAEGGQQVLIPFSKIADIIDPLGPISKFAK